MKEHCDFVASDHWKMRTLAETYQNKVLHFDMNLIPNYCERSFVLTIIIQKRWRCVWHEMSITASVLHGGKKGADASTVVASRLLLWKANEAC